MSNQNLFNTIAETFDHHATESEMSEIIEAVKLDQSDVMTFENLREKVLDWGEGKGILVPENQTKQALKMVSEVGELCDSIIKNDVPDQIDSVGDVLVTVIILAEQLGLDPVKCLGVAYDTIKHRTGKTVNGTFIKS